MNKLVNRRAAMESTLGTVDVGDEETILPMLQLAVKQ